jgi:hypothetical protein
VSARARALAARVLPAALALVALACSRAAPPAGDQAAAPAPLPTVDVAERPDAHASLAEEPVEKRPTAVGGVAGVLPDDFPRDVPLPEPSSLVDFGRGALGGPRIVLVVQAAPAAARAAYEQRLRRAGFAPETAGVWRRGPRELRLEVEPWQGVARIAVEVAAASGR